MKPGIHFLKIWFDEDIVELRAVVSDGSSRFTNQVYVGHADLVETVSGLDAFKRHVHGGLFDLRFGAFGNEYANGALHARFHFPRPGRLLVTCEQESDFEKFGIKTVASRATLFLQSEPGLLDRFIGELQKLASSEADEAFLEGV